MHCYVPFWHRFLTRGPDFQIAAFLLLLGLCNAQTTESGEIKADDAFEHPVDAADAGFTPDIPETDGDEGVQDGDEEDELPPILPPIILLDFDNGTQYDNTTTDEKSKRTVNNGLGYGFERNSLHEPRKYNYYFPSGKTGTTVSIEESISPFLPRTIIEKVPEGDQRSSVSAGSFSRPRQQENRPATSNRAANHRYHDSVKSQPVFGLRTKLTKVSNTEYGGFSPIARPTTETYVEYQDGAYASSTTPQSVLFGSTEEASYPEVTLRPRGYAASSSSRYAYVTPNPQSYAESQRYLGQGGHRTINAQSYSRPTQTSVESSTRSGSLDPAAYVENVSRLRPESYARPGTNQAVESSTPASSETETAGPFADVPRYTVENGVRYENKIFWKYPDGRVSDVPPMTYETYSEYPGSLAALTQTDKSAQTRYEPGPTESNLLSQGPVQFPMAPESGNPPSPFISSDALSSLQQQHIYRLGYQRLVSQKQITPQQNKAGSGLTPTYMASSTTSSPPSTLKPLSGKNQKNRHELLRRPIPKYMVNGPNADYVGYTTENTLRSTLPTSSFISSGKIASPVYLCI